MASASTLYGKAASNYRAAKTLLDYASGDEEQLNMAGFHLQQAVEFAMKYLLEQDGVEYPRTHDIDQLIRIANEGKVDLLLTEYIEDHAEMFSQWEAKSRYILDYSIEQKKIERALKAVDEYLTAIADEEKRQIATAEAPEETEGAEENQVPPMDAED
ncbi:MAG: HEPN domain-containing protein [Eggerthellaceae bacterium]|nr:HEPN domain-containing protein [Eggerthellaceae bacterium]